MAILNTPVSSTTEQPPPLIEAPCQEEITYPDRAGEPMANKTKQSRWIVPIKDNREALLPNDFVAGDLLWYPVKGHPEIRLAPDALVALGRPKGDRSPDKQWQETGTAPQVVFAIWAFNWASDLGFQSGLPIRASGNLAARKREKLAFYDEYGVQEDYTYGPDSGELESGLNNGAWVWRPAPKCAAGTVRCAASASNSKPVNWPCTVPLARFFFAPEEIYEKVPARREL
jgi:hypothetical protein